MRILLIEDDHDTAQYIRNGFKNQLQDVVWCETADDGLARARREVWDIVILDRMLPNKADGLSIVETLRAEGMRTPVLVLSALTSLDDRVHGLRSGSDDYLIKPFAFAELLARCEALLRRSGMGEDVRELRVADLHLDLRTRQAERAGQVISLQPREFQLLEFLMRHQGDVVTRTMLLESVWGYHFEPQTNVVEVQIKRLRDKIDKGFATSLLHTERGVGYVMRKP